MGFAMLQLETNHNSALSKPFDDTRFKRNPSTIL